MFNTTHVHRTINNDLTIAKEKNYSERIGLLNSDLHKAATPENMANALKIAEQTRESIRAEYCNKDNTLIDFVAFSDSSDPYSIKVCFKLNGQSHTISVDKNLMLMKKDGYEIMKDIHKALIETLTAAFPLEHILTLIA